MTSQPVLRLHLSTWLQLLGLMAFLPILMLVGYFYWELESKEKERILQDLHLRSGEIVHSIEMEIREAEGLLEGLAESGSGLRGDVPALYERSKRILSRSPFFLAVALVRSDGEILFNTSIPYGEKTFPAVHLELVRSAIETGRSNLTGLIGSPLRSDPVVAVTVPFKLKDDPNYALRMIIRSQTFSQLLIDKKLPAGWTAGIADSQGILIARNRDHEQNLGKLSSSGILESIRQKNYQPFATVTREGLASTALVAPVHGGDWYLGLAVPDSSLHAPLKDSMARLGLLILLWLGLTALLAQQAAHFLSTQLRRLLINISSPSQDTGSHKKLRVQEFEEIFEGFASNKSRATLLTFNLNQAQAERDEAYDLYENAPCGYHSLDREGRIIRINQTELGWLGYRRDEVLGQPLTRLLSQSGQEKFKTSFSRLMAQGHLDDLEMEFIRKDGSLMTMLVQVSTVQDEAGNLLKTRATLVDITERKRLEAVLELQAHSDALTGLANRRDFYRQAEREIARGHRHGTALSAIILDIDHFKQINDRHGHAAGDRVIRHMGEVLQQVMRETDFPARIGGEEFAVLMPETDLATAVEVAERLRAWIAREEFRIDDDGHSLRVTASIGVAQLGADMADIEQLLKNADSALYLAKKEGRNLVRSSTQSTPDLKVEKP